MRELKRILAATDFGADRDEAVDYACHLAERLHAELHLLHVVANCSLPFRAADEAGRLQAAHQGLGRLPERITPTTLMIIRKTCEGYLPTRFCGMLKKTASI